MTRVTPRRRRRGLALAGSLAVSAIVLSACGVNTSDTLVQNDRKAASERAQQVQADAESREARRGELPTRPAGTVAISARIPSSIVARAAALANSSSTSTSSGIKYQVQIADNETGIRDLCAGRIDLLQISRELTPAERNSCAANGLKVDKPVTIAYAVSVLVTRNGTDIGGDCLTLGGVRSLLAVNSTVTNWRQIGFGDYEFSVAGPPANSGVMAPVMQLALRFPAGQATRSELRADMLTYSDQSDIGAFIAGTDRRDALDRHVRVYTRKLTDERRTADANAIARAEREAARAVVRKIEAENKARAARGEAVADPDALAARNAERVKQAKREAGAKQRAANRRAINRLQRQYRTEQLPSYLGNGRLAIVGYPYYEAHSDILRPLEIDPRTRSAAGSRPDCRFPSQHSISNGSYPLLLPVYLYGDDRALRSETVRPLLRAILDSNAELTRMNDVAGLSRSTIAATRQDFGIEVESSPTSSPSSTSPGVVTSPASPTEPNISTDGAPAPAPGGVPGVDAPQATP